MQSAGPYKKAGSIRAGSNPLEDGDEMMWETLHEGGQGKSTQFLYALHARYYRLQLKSTVQFE